MVKFKNKGNFSKIMDFLTAARRKTRVRQEAIIYAEEIVAELKKATPKDSGLTAESWGYEIKMGGNKTTITFINENLQNGLNVALLLEYGHATATGGWVEGQEYIDPIIKENYLKIVNDKWKELTRL